MSKRNIYITDEDKLRLEHLLASEFTAAIGPTEYLADLQAELQRAVVVDSEAVPHDAITMNSRVCLRDLDTDETEVYTLVYPNAANIAERMLSILAPIGTAILGYRVGDVVRWKVPGGKRRLRVDKVLYQPERDEKLQIQT